jgi:hypothetical protein
MEYEPLMNLKNKLYLVICRGKNVYQNTHRFKYVKIFKLGTLFRNKQADSGKCRGLLNYSAKLYSLFFIYLLTKRPIPHAFVARTEAPLPVSISTQVRHYKSNIAYS